MTTQPEPEALRLADECDEHMVDFADVANELRRLYESNQELLAALKLARSIIGHPDDAHTRMISDAINKAERTTT